ncbi:metallophosphoesterase family protein [Candidatus Poribacteria bacterium]|nr:metallophosphoesterase family protein [Candidatus Poribacteria bacterium]
MNPGRLLFPLSLAGLIAFRATSPAQGLSGKPIAYPDLPAKADTYGFLVGVPKARIASPGNIEVTFSTETPTPPAILSGGLNTLDEELDYPRFHYFCSGHEEGTESRTEHKITADFTKIKRVMPNTPFEPRLVYRIEVYLPEFASTRFLEGRVYFDPATLGDTVNVPFGPFVEQVTSTSALIAWETDRASDGKVTVTGEFAKEGSTSPTVFDSGKEGTRHEVMLEGLLPGHEYEYRVRSGATEVRPYTFKTAGSDHFSFAAMVDSREGNGGGTDNAYGVNSSSLYRLGSGCYYRGADFIVFAGDFINGYTTSVDDFRNMLNSFRWIMGPVHARIPIYEGMGNHESLLNKYDDGTPWGVSLDKPGAESGEAIFGEAFYNPLNGPDNEGPGSPSYKENVYFFDHANTRVFMLNNNYWWSGDPVKYGGCLEGFILPNQLKWLREQVAKADADPAIKHLFFAAQEPPFPNGGHTKDAMWYRGGDTNRDKKVDENDIPVVQNRNEMWAIIAGSPKTVAFITGDEHAYSRLLVSEKTDVGLTKKPDGTEAKFTHPVWQITSGGAGAPWYDKELDLPWSPQLKAHSTQPHYAYFRVEGDDVLLEAYSQAGQRIDEAVLRKDGKNLVD